MYILLVFKKALLKNDYLKTLLITIIKSLKKKKKLFKNNLDRQKKLLLKFWLAHFPM